MRQLMLAAIVGSSVACSADPGDGEGALGADSSSDGSASSSPSSGSSSSSSSETSTLTEASGSESSSADTSAAGSTGTEPVVLVAARFTIPAGTVVEEFVYSAQGVAVEGPTTGRTIVVAIRDVTHADRDQDALCPGSHPLDGCATVDYGAFGTPHDNHLVVDAASGPLELHLHKSREVLGIVEPLPISE